MTGVELCGQRVYLAETGRRNGVAVPCARISGHDGAHHGSTAKAPWMLVQWRLVDEVTS